MPKHLILKNSGNGKGATKSGRPMPLGSPADYPIGSLESRAAARAMVEAMRPPSLPQPDQDALDIYHALGWHLRSPMFMEIPDARVVAVYSRAEELVKSRHQDSTSTTNPAPDLRIMEIITEANGKTPTRQDFIAFMLELDAAKQQRGREAWSRLIPGLEYPKSEIEKMGGPNHAQHQAERLWEHIGEIRRPDLPN